MKNKFYVATEKLHEVSAELLDMGYTEQEPCVSEDELSSSVYIDTNKKTFYFTDEECLKQISLFLKEKHQTTYSETSIKKIKTWKQK